VATQTPSGLKMKKSNIDISIIIVNYKSWKPLRKCLQQLVAIQSTEFNFETIVVDNCSDDGQLALFKSDFIGVKFFENSGNNGFANACNFGAFRAKGAYFLFLNPDTLANAQALEALLQTAKQHPDYGIISCQQCDEKGNLNNQNKLFFSPSRMFGLFRIVYKIAHQSYLNQRFNKSKSIVFPDWVSGSVVFISRSWFEKVKVWCEDYWMYYEDVDLCKKVSELGGKIALLKTVTIIHAHGGSTRINVKTKALTKSEVLISRHVFIHKHFNGMTRFSLQFITVFYQLLINSLMGLLGLLLWFRPKFKVHYYLSVNIFKYYFRLPFRWEWLSERSVNYKKALC